MGRSVHICHYFHGVVLGKRFLNELKITLHNNFDPEACIHAARSGDADALAALMEQYRPYFQLLARLSLNRDLQSKIDASDVAQEAALLVSRDVSQFRGDTEQEFAAWIRQLVANVIANTHRHYFRCKRDVRTEFQLKSQLDQSSANFCQLAGPDSSPSDRAIRREQSVLLATALEQLPKDYRQVLMLREIDGRSLAEIAEQMGRSRNSVQKLWARAIVEIRCVLKDQP